ncbi:2-C-methyl-D-erythritol 4-phosphate cytidylyltransferase [Halioxenophilus sp. WMMB6]|uniref:2-C-methyl-D-erythritol 4-phosphate cytidylyltransferase n=1 Tax=Halioxenophilus sp. WMMB6 TaxID=3073815 RepID=UPI00295F49C1|nr:2-C-methyl-D-erythritol 4-phosphate cytidylyltransferase [Halioxenophilus sp. WMMB6]
MVKTPQTWVVVPAAGIGSRMAAATAKQYLPLAGSTVIEQTLQRLLQLPNLAGIVVALRAGDPIWPTLAVSRQPLITVAPGGDERAHSVCNGLVALQATAAEDDWVLVHDAARPCLSPQLLTEMVQALSPLAVGGVMAVPAADTLKLDRGTLNGDGLPSIEQTLDRRRVWQAQTPQMFRYGLLKAALEKALAENFLVTDEASAMEYCGYDVALFAGRRDNIKITTPEDLALAEFILSTLQ